MMISCGLMVLPQGIVGHHHLSFREGWSSVANAKEYAKDFENSNSSAN